MKPNCVECRWFFPDRKKTEPKCQVPVAEGEERACKFESRKEHADKILAQFNEIVDHPCGNCLNSLLCYQGGEKEVKCSKVKSREEKERHIKYWRDKER